jgi:signal recognition particle GTPase
MSTNGATTTSGAVACDVSFQETAKRIYPADMRRFAAIRALENGADPCQTRPYPAGVPC